MDNLAFTLHGIKFKYDYCIRDRQGGVALVADWDYKRYKVAEVYKIDGRNWRYDCYDEYGTLADTFYEYKDVLRWLKLKADGFALCARQAPDLLHEYPQIG